MKSIKSSLPSPTAMSGNPMDMMKTMNAMFDPRCSSGNLRPGHKTMRTTGDPIMSQPGKTAPYKLTIDKPNNAYTYGPNKPVTSKYNTF